MLWARMMTPHAGQNRGFFFQPEVGDEVVVAFEDGDPERPIILGCVWNGVDTAPSEDFWGGEYAPNDVKRIITKSGNRIQIVDKPGKQSISLATPNHLKISLFENANETGRSMIQLSNANGDILLSAPNGRIHFHSKYFSREAGGGGGALSAAGGGNGSSTGAAAGAQSTSFLSKAEAFGSGLYDGAVKPLVDTIRHPIHALEGIGHAIAHPIDTAGALAHAVKDGGAKALSGDPYAIGMALGTVGSLVVPGAGEAEAAEDAVRVGQVGRLAEASEAAETAEVAKAAEMVESTKTAEAVTATTAAESDETAEALGNDEVGSERRIAAKDPRVRSDLEPKWITEDGELRWPPNNGVDGVERADALLPGKLIDRYGSEFGTFASPVGARFETRSLPYDPSALPYHQYEVLKPIDCSSGKAAAWFDQPGGALQYRLPTSVRDLVAQGFLRPIK